MSNSTAAPCLYRWYRFTAKVQATHMVDIAWTTSLETNNRGFLVERSKDLKAFDKVGEIDEIAANSSALKNYHLTDETPYAGTSYYRLTQTDLSGKTTVYPAVSVVVRDETYGVFLIRLLPMGGLRFVWMSRRPHHYVFIVPTDVRCPFRKWAFRPGICC